MLDKIKTGVAIALLAGASFAVQAAGLGKLTVSSALGQVLAAEIDLVSIQPGELDALTARVASPESYRDAKIEYSSVLRLLRFSVEKRANGQAYLKLTSVAPINEPFVDLLIEVTWPAGLSPARSRKYGETTLWYGHASDSGDEPDAVS